MATDGVFIMNLVEWFIVLVPYALITAHVVTDAMELFWESDRDE